MTTHLCGVITTGDDNGVLFALRVITVALALSISGCSHRAGGTDIWEAVAANDPAAIGRYAAAGGDVNIRDWSGSTPLWVAFQDKKRLSYESLLENGADPNIIMSGRRVVTHWAAAADDSWWLKLALEHGANPNLVNTGSGRPSEGTPFEFVIDNGKAVETDAAIENTKLLIQYGADMDTTSDPDRQPLALAAGANNFKIVLLLLNHGANFRAAQYSGTSLLEQIREKCESKHVFLLESMRNDLDAVRAWLKAHGVDFSEIPK